MATEETERILKILNERAANVREQTRMTAANKLTRDAPGLFIEETLFSCLARFCRHCKGNFEQIEALFKPVVRQFDKDELVRLVDLCAGETTHADFAQTDSIAAPASHPPEPKPCWPRCGRIRQATSSSGNLLRSG